MQGKFKTNAHQSQDILQLNVQEANLLPDWMDVVLVMI